MARELPELLKLKKRLDSETDSIRKIEITSQIKVLQDKAEARIRTLGRDIIYNVKDWDITTIIQKYGDGLKEDENELFIPDYQRDYKWDENNNKIGSRFIESLLLGFPIPYLYISDVNDEDPEKDGRVEIIDGSQRIRTLYYFVNNKFHLEQLKELKELEGFCFEDFPKARQRRLLRTSLRFVELIGEVSESNRRDLFERINSGVKPLESMEVRHGSEDAAKPFYTDVLENLATSELFAKLAPLSDKKKANRDHLELVLRYFAYSYDLDNYKGTVKPFLDAYLTKVSNATETHSEDRLLEYKNEFKRVLDFVDQYFGNMGFKKTITSKTTTRARYEAIAVGVGNALKEVPDLEPAVPVSEWILSDEFQAVVGADSANNTTQLLARINFVKNKLLIGE
ncbi:hypothetical protein VINI7043_09811 [Vibrio nigripulchritudo ATCC 27043]|uniref:DUF262 domain-containing protein n=1 Tax=Vibrio nigripulchritudo TaxID=28173 RepID=UPI00021C41B6|nr:DUF262 domain-containing protein [Vibrio nigripulchritudo]EGU59515.1 hypothetical protein VINI7043_09811 [Vibrio nigripulchritudo ATCC 27043]